MDLHTPTGFGEYYRRREAVWTGADYQCFARHVFTLPSAFT